VDVEYDGDTVRVIFVGRTERVCPGKHKYDSVQIQKSGTCSEIVYLSSNVKVLGVRRNFLHATEAGTERAFTANV
jgi:hypothetical protein